MKQVINIQKMLLLAVLLSTSTTFNTEATSSLYTNLSTKISNVRNSIKPHYDKVVNSKLFVPSLGALGATIVMYCNYASYRDYHQLTLIPKEDRIAAANTLAQFIINTICIGRHSYNPNALGELYPYTGLPNELIRGYHDIVGGQTSFVLTENQMKAFRLLCGLPFKASVGFFGSLTVLSYALQPMINKIKATEFVSFS